VQAHLPVPDQLSLSVRRLKSRAFVAAVVAAAAVAIGPARADAAPASLVDDSIADFAAAPAGAGTWVTEPGAVMLRPTGLAEAFDGPTLPPGWAPEPWSPPAGSATFGSGALTLDGVRVHPDATQDAPQHLEFRATFTATAFQHVGLGNTFNEPPWAMFSTGGGALPIGLYARTLAADGTASNDPIDGVDPLVPHVYRIEWLPTEVRYVVDAILVKTHAIAIAAPMRPVASDLSEGSGAVQIDWLGLGAHPASGVFESRVHDTGDERAVWGALTAGASGGGTVEFETRAGNTAAPDVTWSAWQPTGPGGAIASPIRRYIQYRATLSHPSGGSPSLEHVELGYEIDTVSPTVVIDGVDVSGGSASVRFSSADDDLDRLECRLGANAPFVPCTSPHEFGGLSSGDYTVFVRAVDEAGNVGSVVGEEFSVDVDAPTVVIDGVDVSGGSASVRFSSADGDVDRFECRLGVSGTFAACSSPRGFSGLASGSYTVFVRAVDESGNESAVVQREFTIPEPPASGGGGGGSGPPAPGNPAPEPELDKTPPAIELLTRSARASRKGVVSLRVRCPEGEIRCKVTVRIAHGRTRSQRASVSLDGRQRGSVRVRLAKATRSLLAARGRLKVSALVTARDEAGSSATTKHKLILRPAV
jgi:hypothetical protein